MTTLVGAHHTQTSKVLILVGLLLGLGISAFWVLFIVAEMLSDPGGWLGAMYAASLLIPMVILGVFAWFAPRIAAFMLTFLVALYAIANILTMFFGTAWARYEDAHGPIGLIIGIVLCVPCLVLGRERPLLAGTLLLVGTLVPIGVAIVSVPWMGTVGGGIAMIAVGSPFIIGGALMLLAGFQDRREQLAGRLT